MINTKAKQREMIKAESHRRTYVPRAVILSVISFCFAFLFFNSVYALPNEVLKDTYIPHKQSETLQFSFSDNSQTVCNITTLNTPSGFRLINITMTNQQGTFSSTVNGKNFTGAGVHCLNILCNNGSGTVCRDVTTTGITSTIGFYVIFILLITGAFVLGYRTRNNYVMMFGSILVLFLGFFIIKFGIDVFKDTQTTWAIGIITWAIGIICIYTSLEEQLKVWD